MKNCCILHGRVFVMHNVSVFLTDVHEARILTCLSHDFSSDEPENRYAEKDDKFDFKDNSEEFTTYHEKTKTTHTEKITTKRRTEKKKIDLGAAASQLGRDQGDNQVSFKI